MLTVHLLQFPGIVISHEEEKATIWGIYLQIQERQFEKLQVLIISSYHHI